MKWTLNDVQKLYFYDFIEKKFETNHTVWSILYAIILYETVLLSFERHLCQREISSPTRKHFQNTDPRFQQVPKIKFFKNKFYKTNLYKIQYSKLWFGWIDTENEIERCIMAIN